MNIPVIPTFSCSCWVAYSESPPVYLGMSLELLWTVWSHFKVRYSLVLACNCSKKSIVAPQMQSQLNCRILISCACHFLGTYPFFSLLRLASSACESLGSSIHGILQVEILGGLPYPPPGDLPSPGTEPESLALQADSSPLSQWGSPIVIYLDLYIHLST